MNIGIVIGRIGGTDGVALETEKWIAVLRRMGHNPRVLTGELAAPLPDVTILEELAFSHEDCVQGQEDAFFHPIVDEKELLERLRREARHIEMGILAWLESERIEVLITQNATALPCHLTMGMALAKVMRDTGIASVSHDHDFSWERGDRYATPYEGVREIMKECFPPELPNVRHVVINTWCRGQLAQGGIDAVVIPNVMDFETPFGVPDDHNAGIHEALGLDPADQLLFQITRIVRRKGIETAVELVHRLDDPHVRLVITGTATDDRLAEYENELKAQADRLGIRDKVLFVGPRFANVRGTADDGSRIFSLSDSYAAATACTYFSRYEGFGNAFVEALVARKPVFVNNYIPVYWPDIGSKGFRTVQIEDNDLTEEAVDDVRRILADPEERRAITDHNFALGREHFSFDVLQGHLERLLADG